MKAHTLKVWILVALTNGIAATALAQAQRQAPTPVCSALVEVANDLYLVKADGTLLGRFSSDGLPKQSVSLTSDGTKVAFMPKSAGNGYTVATRTGQLRSYSSAADRPLLDVAWGTSDALGVRTHLGRESSRFEFLKVPTPLPVKLAASCEGRNGSTCAISSDKQSVACLNDTDVLVDDRTVLSDTGFTGAPQVDLLRLSVGASSPIAGIADLEVQVTSIASGVTLRVKLPTANWIESRVAAGDFMEVQLEDLTLGLFPKVISTAQRTVEIDVRTSTLASAVFGRALAWRFQNEGVALLRNTASGAALAFLKAVPLGRWIRAGEGPYPLRSRSTPSGSSARSCSTSRRPGASACCPLSWFPRRRGPCFDSAR